MTSAKELEDKYLADLAKLQDECPHTVTEEMDEYWAPGHSSGFSVRACTNCWKVLERLPQEAQPAPEVTYLINQQVNYNQQTR